MDDLDDLDFSFTCNKCSFSTKSILEIKIHAVEHKKETSQGADNTSAPEKEPSNANMNDQSSQQEQVENPSDIVPIQLVDQQPATEEHTAEEGNEEGYNDLVSINFNDTVKPSVTVDSCSQSEPVPDIEQDQSVNNASSSTEGIFDHNAPSTEGVLNPDGNIEQNDKSVESHQDTNDAGMPQVKSEAIERLMVDMGTQMVDMGTQMSPMPVSSPGRGRPPSGGKGAAKRKTKIPVREQIPDEPEEEEEESTEDEKFDPQDDDYEPEVKSISLGGRKRHRPLTRSKSKGVVKKKVKKEPIPLKCTSCDFTCEVKADLKNHMVDVHNEVNVKIEENSDEVESESESNLVEGIPIVKRINISHDSIPDDRYTCMVCREYKCKFKKDLARHKYEAHNIGQPVQYKYVSQIPKDRYKCMACNYSCKFQRQLRAHKRRVHPRPKIMITKSKIVAKTKSSKSTVSPDRYECKECDFKCKFKGLLRAHRIKEHRKEPPPARKKGVKELECELCGKMIRGTQHHMERHHKTHTGEKPYECHICGRVFAERGRLNVHLPIHNETRPFLCEDCGKSFKRAINLRMHRKIHVEVKPYQCELCAYRCTRHDTLNLHMKRKHLKLRRVLCTFCGKKFFSDKECQAHTARKHLPRPTPFQCTLCPAAFPFAYNLRAHMKKHPEHKPYKCEYCGFESRSKASLQDHEKQHTATGHSHPKLDPNREKPYHCGYCEFRTSSKAYMKDHVKQHTGEKEKKCDLCDYETTTSSNLYKHRKRQHGILGMPARANKGGRGRLPRANALLASQVAHQHIPLTLTISADDLGGQRPHHAEEERTAADAIEDETEIVHIPMHQAVQHLYNKDRKSVMYTQRDNKAIVSSVITDALAEARNVVQSDIYASHMIPTSLPTTNNLSTLPSASVSHSGSTFTMAHAATLPHGAVVNLPEGIIQTGIPLTTQGIPVSSQGLHVPVTVAMQNVQTPAHATMFQTMMNMHY